MTVVQTPSTAPDMRGLPPAQLDHRGHARRILTLGLPLVASSVAQFGMGLIDTLMLGRYDVAALAGQVLGNVMFFALFLFGSGFAWAAMPMIAAAEGRGETGEARRVTRMAIWLSTLFGLACLPVLLSGEPIFLALGQEPAIAAMAGTYLSIVAVSIIPAMFARVGQSLLSAMERTRVVLWITLSAVTLNAALNWLLIFGNWGVPELGLRGAAWATLAAQVALAGGFALYARRALPHLALFSRMWRPDWEAFGRVFRLGWPIGVTTLAEVGLFEAAAIMVGWLGAAALAAHGIAMQITAVAFMVQVGLSQVATVRASAASSRDDPEGLRRGAQVLSAIALAAALASVAVMVLAPETLLRLFLRPGDPEADAVVAIGLGLMVAAALFHVVDAAQVVALGLLRGLQDTRVPMVIAMVSYWVVGVPVSYALGFPFGMGAVGVWLGLALGLSLAGLALTWRFWSMVMRQGEPGPT